MAKLRSHGYGLSGMNIDYAIKIYQVDDTHDKEGEKNSGDNSFPRMHEVKSILYVEIHQVYVSQTTNGELHEQGGRVVKEREHYHVFDHPSYC